MPRYNATRAFLGKANRSMARKAINSLASKYMGSGAYNLTRAFLGKANRGAARKAINSTAAKYFAGSGAYRKRRYSKKRWYGSGAYGTTSHAASVSAKSHHTTVHHKEFLGVIYTPSSPSGDAASGGGSPFCSNSQISGGINPGNPYMFPWLSGIATNYEKFRFHKLIFSLKSLTSDAISSASGTAAALGEVMMACNYNAECKLYSTLNDTNDVQVLTPFLNSQQMLNSEGSMACKPSQHMTFGVECAGQDSPYKWYYVTAQTVEAVRNEPAGTTSRAAGDTRLYFPGIMQVASEGVPVLVNDNDPPDYVSIALQQIWVEYDVEFETCILPDGPPPPPPPGAFVLGTETSKTDFFTVSGGQTFSPINSLGISLTGAANTITVPPQTFGTYEVLLECIGSATAMTSAGTPTVTVKNCVSEYIYDVSAVSSPTDTLWFTPAAGDPSISKASLRHLVTFGGIISNQPATIVYSIPTGWPTGSDWFLSMRPVGNFNI